MKKVVFIDRDGVLNKRAKIHDYIKSWKEFRWLKKAKNAISLLNKKFIVIIISNQRGISRGLMKREDVEEIHQNMQKDLKKIGAKIDAFYYCPHNIRECDCRKPETGLIKKAQKEMTLDLKEATMIGDDKEDIILGKRLDLKTILILTSYKKNEIKNWQIKPDIITNNLFEAALFLKKQS